MPMVQAVYPETSSKSGWQSMATFWNGSEKFVIEKFVYNWKQNRTPKTRKQVQAIIDAIDINEDGEVDYQEFLVS